MTRPILFKFAQPDFINNLRYYVQEEADQATGGVGGGAKWERDRSASLRMFDNYLASLGPEDQRIVTLERLCSAVTNKRHEFKASPNQGLILARYGTQPDMTPDPRDLLSEFVMAGVTDYIAGTTDWQHGAEFEKEQTAAAISQRDAEREAVAELHGKLDAAASEIASLEEQGEEDRRRIEFLERVADPGEVTGAPAKKSRRKKVTGDGFTGIYTVETADGEVFEINYPDAEKKTRWKMLEPGVSIEEAVTLRDQLKGQPHEEAIAA